MREYGVIHSGFWNPNKKIGKCSDAARLLAAYLLTGPHSNSIGCMYLPVGYISADLGWTERKCFKTVSELFQNGFITVCEQTNWILIPQYLEMPGNQPKNPNQKIANSRYLEMVPRNVSFIKELLTVSKQFRNSFKTVPEWFRNIEIEQDIELKEKESIKEKEKNQNNTQTIEKIPLSNGKEFEITSDLISEWQKAYPKIDIIQELKEIRAWNLSNPAKRKTPSGIKRHINAWLKTEQEKIQTLTNQKRKSGKLSHEDEPPKCEICMDKGILPGCDSDKPESFCKCWRGTELLKQTVEVMKESENPDFDQDLPKLLAELTKRIKNAV